MSRVFETDNVSGVNEISQKQFVNYKRQNQIVAQRGSYEGHPLVFREGRSGRACLRLRLLPPNLRLLFQAEQNPAEKPSGRRPNAGAAAGGGEDGLASHVPRHSHRRLRPRVVGRLHGVIRILGTNSGGWRINIGQILMIQYNLESGERDLSDGDIGIRV